MQRTETIIIGAGQAGLSLSRCLTDAGRDHVVFERGRLAERWRSERWDSLRLLTPNWMTRLPGWSYDGPAPDAFMTVPELVTYFENFAASFDAPVRDETTVTSVRPADGGYRVETTQGPWTSTNVVIATGVEGHPNVPAMASMLAGSIHQITPTRYRNPESLPSGGVLVVGASSSGVQLAEELAAAGRDVVVAVGSHSRLPRRYRGLDIFWWLDKTGLFDTTIDQLPSREAGSRAPSIQLIGRPDQSNIDLSTLQAAGVQLAGRLEDMDGTRARFGHDLAATVAASESRMHRTLDAADRYVEQCGLTTALGAPDRPAPVDVPVTPTEVDLQSRGITTVLWATGFGRSYPWLHAPVFDQNGEIRQRHGVTPSAGLYVLGLRFQHHRNSNFIDGVGRDATFLAQHITAEARTRTEMAA